MGSWRKLGNDEKLFFWCKANKKALNKTVCKECTYVQKYINQIDESFDFSSDNEHTFPASYFHEEPISDAQTIEEGLKLMN